MRAKTSRNISNNNIPGCKFVKLSGLAIPRDPSLIKSDRIIEWRLGKRAHSAVNLGILRQL